MKDLGHHHGYHLCQARLFNSCYLIAVAGSVSNILILFTSTVRTLEITGVAVVTPIVDEIIRKKCKQAKKII